MSLNWKHTSTFSKSCKEKQRERTERIAHKLYQNRLLLERPGDARTDWEAAGEIIRNPLRTILFVCHRPFIKLEKRIWEPLLVWANKQAWLSLLGVIGNVGIIIAVLTYIGSEKHRRDAVVFSAWQTISSAHGQSGSGGRRQTLEFLNASPGANWRRKFPWFCAPLPLCTWPAESLDGINLSVEPANNILLDKQSTSPNSAQPRKSFSGVYLKGIQLPRASLVNANLEGTNLSQSNLRGANLSYANLEGTNLSQSNLRGANLSYANLEGIDLERAILVMADLRDANLKGVFWHSSDLTEANLAGVNLEDAMLSETILKRAYLADVNLRGANLSYANLESANLWSADLKLARLWTANLEDADLREAILEGASLLNANLKEADLQEVNLEDANLGSANLEGANLLNANLKGADLTGANLTGTRGLAQDQLIQAKLCRTTLPSNIRLGLNRDCQELGIDPKTGIPLGPIQLWRN